MSQSLLKLQIGPVQDFIAQARSTRDLWSGSYLLSWMMGQVVALLRQDTQTEIIFPSILPGKTSVVSWIEGKHPADLQEQKKALIPCIPNCILAIMPVGFDKEKMELILNQVFKYEPVEGIEPSVWRRIANTCWKYFKDENHPLPEEYIEDWHQQLQRFWQISWILWPYLDRDKSLTLYKKLPLSAKAPFSIEQLTQNGQWHMDYHLASHRLDARRQTRNFSAWFGAKGRNKDYFSGREEAIANKSWLKGLLRGAEGRSDTLNHLFRAEDELGAVNLIKRVWHRPCLQGKMGFQCEGFYIPSIPGIAAFPWVVRVWDKIKQQGHITEFARCVKNIDHLLDLELPKQKQDWESPARWMMKVDWQIFQKSFWEELARQEERLDKDEAETVRDGLECLKSLTKAGRLGVPGSYYAVVAMDGDGMGKWLSGEKLSVPIEKDFHKDVSRGMAQCARDFAHLFIEDPDKAGDAQKYPFQGKLIYSGGDDILAILPAAQALECARRFRVEFQKLMAAETKLQSINDPQFTASAGVAIGHIKAPLQDMVQEAEDAQKRAKRELKEDGWNRDAIAVTLYKRGGEIIQWGTRFDWDAFDLLELFQKHFRKPLGEPEVTMPIAGVFPHRLAELLSRYGPTTPINELLRTIVLKELKWVLVRQTRIAGAISTKLLLKKLRIDLYQRVKKYLGHLDGRPLSEFYNLFLIEAFISRTEE